MRGRRWGWLVLGLLLANAGCAASDDEASDDRDALSFHEQAIIYGEDDRVEVYEHPDPALRAVAQSSFVALVPRAHFARTAGGDFAIFTRPLKDAFQVCDDARFASQPTAADCSGVLIDDDLVLTAGHCFSSEEACERFAFMFDYFFKEKGKLEPIGWGDVYGCRRVVQRQVTIDASMPRIDYAVVQLDRTPVGRVPVPLRTTPLVEGEPLSVLGSVSGLPAKLDSGAHVLSTRATSGDFFLLDSDTFQGSSGSGVFDIDARLVGVLVRGGEDYIARPDASCKVPKVISALSDGGGLRPNVGEEATYIARAVEGVCAKGWPSPRLCGTSPRCGDGLCTSGESRAACPADCECTSGECALTSDKTAAHAGAPAPPAKRKKGAGSCSISPAAPTDWWGSLSILAASLWVAARRRRCVRVTRG